jgi:type IV secretory pathway VirB2 component (pilin)
MAHLRLTPWHKVIGSFWLTLTSTPVMAAALPFTSTLTTLKNAITGPFLLAAAMIMIVVTCVMLAFGEWGDGFKKLINIALWLSIAFGVTGFMSSLFGSSAVG